MKNKNSFLIGTIMCLPFLGWAGNNIVKRISFDRNCGGYLTRASNANTIPLAKEELGRAIQYLESRNMTTGYTSVVYTTPNEDIRYWYRNLKASYDEIDVLSQKSELTSLEQSNTLLKLRDSLSDHQEGKESLTCPPGIAMYPHNLGNMAFGIFACFFLALACLYVGPELR